MGKTRKYIPEIRIRKPYRREPKLRVNMPVYEPFDMYLDIDPEDNDEEDQHRGNRSSQDREMEGE